jgi:hypothetical protein
MSVSAAGAHFGRHPNGFHQFLRGRSRADCRLGMTVDAVRALRHMGDRDGNDLFDLSRQCAIGKDGFAERIEGGLLIWRQLTAFTGNFWLRCWVD